MELNPLKMIDPLVIVSVVVIFTITHFVLRRTFFLPVIDAMEKRQARFDAADLQRDEAADLSRGAEAEAEAVLERARGRAERVGSSIRETANEVRAERLGTARAEVAAFLDQGRQAIATEREAELTKLRGETAACVSLACKRLLGGAETNSVDEIVDRLVAKHVH